MEDHRKTKTPSDKQSDEKIVELTKEMALSNQEDGEIIDLTKSVDGKDAPAAGEVPPTPASEAPAPEPDTANTAAAQDPPSRQIEDQVEAAFESVQSEPAAEKREPVPDEQLFDHLTEITERVDESVRQHETAEPENPGETAVAPPLEPGLPDDDAIAADAAVFEAAIGADPAQPPESDIFDPAEPEQDEEIIELTDIVDPDELAPRGEIAAEEDDEEIIELTDIVDPAELAAELDGAETAPDTAAVDEPDTSDDDLFVEPLETAATEAAVPPMLDDTDTAPAVDVPEPAAAETDEIADMFMEELAPEVPAGETDAEPADVPAADFPLPLAGVPAEEEEQVIQLSDVLGQPDSEERPPIEKIKMGAEEDLEAQPVSLEREDAANALGLNLEMQQNIESAVEHLLATKYADKVQRLIDDAVEKAVAEKVAAIKRAMRDDDAAV